VTIVCVRLDDIVWFPLARINTKYYGNTVFDTERIAKRTEIFDSCKTTTAQSTTTTTTTVLIVVNAADLISR